MNPFTFARVPDAERAVREISQNTRAKVIAGGTNLLDLMKEEVARPAHLVDINDLPYKQIEEREDGGLRLGALATNADTAEHPLVQSRYPLISKAILSGASPQLRNMATNGGNLLQRTRCYYFYDAALPCNKRKPGSGCPAIHGVNRIHAILGASDHCIAVHPSDFCVALSALDAVIQVRGPQAERSIPIGEFHRLPGDTPHIDTNLATDEIVLAIDLPPRGFAEHFTYLKLRDREEFAFALVSVAAAVEMDGGVIREARLALGGVSSKPWRDPGVEALLRDRSPDAELFQRVADQSLRGARGYGFNNFKIELARRAIIRALTQITGFRSYL